MLLKFKSLLLLLLLFQSAIIFSQEAIPRKLLDAFPKVYDQLLNHDVDEKYIENYAMDNARGKFQMTFFHNVYYDQPVLVSYVKSILLKLAPEEVEGIDVFITRSTYSILLL